MSGRHEQSQRENVETETLVERLNQAEKLLFLVSNLVNTAMDFVTNIKYVIKLEISRVQYDA